MVCTTPMATTSRRVIPLQFTSATDNRKTRLRPHVSHLCLQPVAASAARPRQNPLRGFLNRAGVDHGRKIGNLKMIGDVWFYVYHVT